MSAEKVIDRIRKLLAIAESTPFEPEAQTAAALAQRLLLEHELSISDLGDSDTDRNFEAAELLAAFRAPPVSRFIVPTIEEFFFCFAVYGRSRNDGLTRIMLFGRKEHLAVGRFVYVFLSRIFRGLWPPYKAAHLLAERDRQAFWLGMQHGLEARLRAERAEITAGSPLAAGQLIRARDDLERSAGRHFGALETRKSNFSVAGDHAVFLDGEVRGRQIDISRPLPAPDRRLSITDH